MSAPDTFEFRLQPWEFEEAETSAFEPTVTSATAMWQSKARNRGAGEIGNQRGGAEMSIVFPVSPE